MLTNKTVNTTNKPKQERVERVETDVPPHRRPTLITFENFNGNGLVISAGGLGADFTAGGLAPGATGAYSSSNLIFIAAFTPNLGSIRNLTTVDGTICWLLASDPTSGISIHAAQLSEQEMSKYRAAIFPERGANLGDPLIVDRGSGKIQCQCIGIVDNVMAPNITVGAPPRDAAFEGRHISNPAAFAEPGLNSFGKGVGYRIGDPFEAIDVVGKPVDRQKQIDFGRTTLRNPNFRRVRSVAECSKVLLDLQHTESQFGNHVFHKNGAYAGFIAGADPATGYAVMADAYFFQKACFGTINGFNDIYNNLFYSHPLNTVLEIPLIYNAFRTQLALSSPWLGLNTVYDRDTDTFMVLDVPEAIDDQGNIVPTFAPGSVSFGTPANTNIPLMNELHQYAHRGVWHIDSVSYTDFNTGVFTTLRGGNGGTNGSFQGALDTALLRCDQKDIVIGGNWTTFYNGSAPIVIPAEYKFEPGTTTDLINGTNVKRLLIETSSQLKFERQWFQLLAGTTFTSMEALPKALIRFPNTGFNGSQAIARSEPEREQYHL